MVIFQPKRQGKYLVSQPLHLLTGVTQVKYALFYHHPDLECTVERIYLTLWASLLLYSRKGKLCIVESPHVLNWAILKDKNILCNPSSLITLWLQIAGLELIGSVQGYKPFWNSQCVDKSAKLWLPTGTACVGSHLSSSSSLWIPTIQNSLFSMEEIVNPKTKNLQMTYCPLSTSIAAEKMENVDIRARKIRIYPTSQQKHILRQWMGTYRYVYNRALDGINKGVDKYNFMELRNKYVTEKNNTICHKWEFLTPKDVRASACRDLEKAYKSTLANKKAGNIKYFKMRFKSKHSPQCIEIPKSAVKYTDKRHLDIFPSFLGSMRSCKDKQLPIKYDCRLKYANGKYWLVIPFDANKKQVNGDGECSMDPGVRKMYVIYSDKRVTKLSTNKGLLERYRMRLDKLRSMRDKRYIKDNKWRRSSDRLKNKITNAVDDIHYKLINKLVSENKSIYLPKFESQQWMGINANIGRDMNFLKHYTFKRRLEDTVNRTPNVQLVWCTEEYTSKTCTNCGFYNNIKQSEIYSCNKCSIVLDRDVNGARNILIMNT